MKTILIFIFCLLTLNQGIQAISIDTDKQLSDRGFSIIPLPQEVSLKVDNIIVDASWQVVSKIGDDIAVKELTNEVEELFNLRFSTNGTKQIILSVQEGVVKGSDDPELNKQGYIISINKERILIKGNSKTGLFYGVQSMLQLLRRDNQNGSLVLPEGEIKDWPDLQLRFIHWDTKNHLDRMATLKEYIDRLARIKANMISFEIWDKFRFPTDPEIGVKEGFTPAQLQELVDYGLERYIQIVPNIQAPAHFQWALKHEKYAHLRADGSDYQACMCDPEVDKFIFSLYQDVIDATKGVDYFHASTDEVYYSGICSKCDRPYTPENRSLAFVDFVNKAHDFLSSRGRRMIYWGEWPLMPEHIKLLPSDIIEGVLGSSYFVGRIQPITEEEYITEENKNGIRQLVYTTQAASLAPINITEGGMRQSMENLHQKFTLTSRRGNPIGSFGAGWDDRGPHSELYWLGWFAVASYSWNIDSPKDIERFVAKFMTDFYGSDVHGMVDIYRDMNNLSNFWNSSWDKVVPEVPGLGTTRASFGNSDGKWTYPRPLSTYLLPPPALPFTEGLNVRPVYTNEKYKDLVEEAKKMEALATTVIYKLEENREKADRNDYNFSVLLVLTRFMRHHTRLLLNLNEIEGQLLKAEKQAAVGNANGAVEALLFANGIAKGIIQERESSFNNLKDVFSETRVDGYLTLENRYLGQEKAIGIEQWLAKLHQITLQYAKKNNMDSTPIENIINRGIFTGESTGE